MVETSPPWPLAADCGPVADAGCIHDRLIRFGPAVWEWAAIRDPRLRRRGLASEWIGPPAGGGDSGVTVEHPVEVVLLQVADECCGGRVVSALEGGYDLGALASCAAVHVRSLMAGAEPGRGNRSAAALAGSPGGD